METDRETVLGGLRKRSNARTRRVGSPLPVVWDGANAAANSPLLASSSARASCNRARVALLRVAYAPISAGSSDTASPAT